MLKYVRFNKLRRAITKARISQVELAEETGLDQSHISRFLAGKRGLSYFSYAAICKAINADPADFLNEEGKKLLTGETV